MGLGVAICPQLIREAFLLWNLTSDRLQALRSSSGCNVALNCGGGGCKGAGGVLPSSLLADISLQTGGGGGAPPFFGFT